MAVIVDVPALIPVAKPDTSITASAPFEDIQTTCDVMSCVLLSEKTPVAVNCALPLIPTTVVTGVTTMFVRTAGVTVNEAVADIELKNTEIVVWPADSPIARPLELTPATLAEEDSHDKPAVTGWRLPSL